VTGATGVRLEERVRDGGYAAAVVSALLEARLAGERDFERAWDRAIAAHPSPATWRRRYERRALSAVEFLRARCEAEWAGRVAGRPCVAG
jgi:hypothetical protein